ncbi:SUMF1/EgtB/PvdO family nonheme iron enzyme, partial [Planctomycetota bacterium]
KFVDHGGYEKQEYWKHKILKDGKELSWEQAKKDFRDTTNRPGPSTWKGGTYPSGKQKFPVSGVCWYEAAAYAEFVGKKLPTIYHWQKAACYKQAGIIIPLSNFNNEGLAPVGHFQGIGSTGLYDMAGNVREWCWNAASDSGEHKYILGGSWTDPTYLFSEADTCTPWDRSPENGFRCIKHTTGSIAASDTTYLPVQRPTPRDYTQETPVLDETYTSWLRDLYSYDRTGFNVHVEKVDENSDFWKKEKITFDASYGSERVIAYLFLPKHVKPPFQTIIYCPHIGSTKQRSSEKSDMWLLPYLIQSGRAFIYPVYKGTFERRFVEGPPSAFDTEYAYRDWIIQYSKDFRRSIDYLETRNDIDTEKVACIGISWGSELGPIMLALEKRIRAAIFMNGGFRGSYKPSVVDPFNFAHRVKVPILMINGREDALFPEKTSQIPMYELFGTAAEDKKRLTFSGGHTLMGAPDNMIAFSILDWLDQYIGTVD